MTRSNFYSDLQYLDYLCMKYNHFTKPYDELLEKSAALRDNCGNSVEEFEIDVIDGMKEEFELVNAIGVNQCNIAEVIEYIESSDENDWPAIFFLLDNSIVHNLDDAKDLIDDVCITESSLIDAATECLPKSNGLTTKSPHSVF